jgi:hypothetical protein
MCGRYAVEPFSTPIGIADARSSSCGRAPAATATLPGDRVRRQGPTPAENARSTLPTTGSLGVGEVGRSNSSAPWPGLNGRSSGGCCSCSATWAPSTHTTARWVAEPKRRTMRSPAQARGARTVV